MSRHPLHTAGSWVELRDADDLRAADRIAIELGMTGTGGVQITQQMRHGIIAAMVQNWSLELPVPSQDQSVLGRLSISDYQALKKLIGPAEDVIFPDDPEPEGEEALAAAKADPASPTGGADAS